MVLSMVRAALAEKRPKVIVKIRKITRNCSLPFCLATVVSVEYMTGLQRFSPALKTEFTRYG